MSRLEDLARAGNADVNPLKSDPELQVLLKRLDHIKKYKKFQGWKAKFLDRLEQFLYEEGMTPAQKACNDFEAILKKFVKMATKVQDFIEKGQLSNTKKTVKAALALNEMCNSLTSVVKEVETLIPSRAQEERKRGFTKFHLGAVLIRQGFHQYITMKVIEDALKDIGEKADEVADRQQHDLFAAYIDQVQRFCDVMADLNLYEVMMKCLQFAEEPDDESEEPPMVQITIKTHDGKTLRLELEVTETIADIKDAIADGCEMVPERQVLSFQGKELSENGKTLEEYQIPDGATILLKPFMVPIIVNTTNGKKIEIMIDPSDKLGAIKKQLEKESGVEAENQNLLMNGIPLGDDNQSADFYGIKAGSELDMEPKSFKVTVEMPDGSTFDIELNASDTSDTIKARIEAETGMAIPRQVLKFEGKELSEGDVVKDLGIKDGSKIKVSVFKIPIKVNTMDGNQINAMIDPTDSLGNIKKQLEGESGLSVENQKLCMNGLELVGDDNSAEFYGIKTDSELDLEPRSIKVNIEMPNGKKHAVQVNPSDTSDIIKSKIEEETGMAAPRQVLKYEGKAFPDGKTAKDLDVKAGSTIKVEIFKVPITVSTMNGKQIKVMVDPTAQLDDIKKQLENESGLSRDNQRLFMNRDELLDDSKTAADYGIGAGSELDLEPKSIKVTVEMPDGKEHTVEVKPSDTSHDIKSRITNVTGLEAPRQVLKFEGKELPSGKTVKQMGVQDGSPLKVELFKVPVTVNTMDGRQIKVMVDPADTLGDIKKQLAKESGLSADNQNLFMNSQPLAEDTKTAEDYGIEAGSVLDLEPKAIRVTVQMPDGKEHTVEVKPSDTSNGIKGRIADETGMTAPRQVLKFEGKELPNGPSVKEMGIQDGSAIKVDIFRIPVTVNIMDGGQIKVMVDPADTLGDIKKQLEKQAGLSADNQNLFLNGQPLGDDNKTAADYGIEAGCELDLEPKTIKVIVEMPDGKEQTVDVTPSDTRDGIKAAISKETGMAAPRQVLKFEGKELPSGQTVKEMGIRDGSTIKVDIFKVPVTVETMDGQEIKVMVDPTDTIGDVKKQLEKKSGVPANNQRLFMNGKDLADDKKTAGDYGVQAGSKLDLEPKSVRVTVDMPDGKSYAVDIKPSDNSDGIKAKIAKETGMEAPRQVLKFDGKELPNGATVRDMGIREGSAIQVDVFKLPIEVKIKGGETIKMKVETIDPVAAIKNTIQRKTGLAPIKQCLKFGEQELDNDRRQVGECGIGAGSILTVEPHLDPIIFIDIKCGTLFGIDRDEVIEKGALTTNQDNKLEYVESAKDSASRERILKAMMESPTLGVATQVVVEKLEVEDYDLEEAEKVKNVWGVKLKKREKNKKGEEFIFVDPKTGAAGELSRKKYIEMKIITPISTNKGETLEEREQDTMVYDKYIANVRQVFGIQAAT